MQEAAIREGGSDSSSGLLFPTNRRTFLGRVGIAGVGAVGLASGLLTTGCGSGSGTLPNTSLGATTPTTGLPTGFSDTDILNFALNLEYLEAEYYLRAVTGGGLANSEIGGGAGEVVGGRQVSFTTPAIAQYAQEIATDERAHVNLLRSALGGAAVSRPPINFTAAFDAAAQAAGLGASFDPFANETNFLIGSFVFEDVGVTAYRGGSGLLQSPDIIDTAAGILATEAYHAGEIRTLIYQAGGTAVQITTALSALRAQAGGGKDQPVVLNGAENIVPTDENGLVFARTPAEVLRIVYLSPSGTVSSGGFFPAGLNGTVKTAV